MSQSSNWVPSWSFQSGWSRIEKNLNRCCLCSACQQQVQASQGEGRLSTYLRTESGLTKICTKVPIFVHSLDENVAIIRWHIDSDELIRVIYLNLLLSIDLFL